MSVACYQSPKQVARVIWRGKGCGEGDQNGNQDLGFFIRLVYNVMMNRFLLSFLMFVMLMPGLACGPFMASKAQASMSQMPLNMKDCPGIGTEAAGKKPLNGDVPTFFKDCARADLQKVDGHASLKKPVFSSAAFPLAWVDTIQHDGFLPRNLNAIRGPPPDLPAFSQTQPSVLLTTQRFRE